MSYLLTEIALEMLGYKFYDIDGNIGPTTFQGNSQFSANNLADDDTGRTDESLETLLGLAANNDDNISQPHTVSATETTVDDEETNDAAAATVVTADISYNNAENLDADSANSAHSSSRTSLHNLPEQQPPQPPVPQQQQQKQQQLKQSILPKALAQLLDHEYERIRTQIIRNKKVFIQPDAELMRRPEQRNIVLQETMTKFDKQERVNLQRELSTMHTFRKMIERSLYKVNAENYDKYKRISRGFVQQQSESMDDEPIEIDGHLE